METRRALGTLAAGSSLDRPRTLLFRASHSLIDGLSAMFVMRAIFDGRAGVGPDPAGGVGASGGTGGGGPARADERSGDPDAGTLR